jgi:hypothetical protein
MPCIKVVLHYHRLIRLFETYMPHEMDGNSSHFSTLRMRTEMVLETLAFSPFNHLTQLVA